MLLVVPTAGENVTHVSSDIKVQKKKKESCCLSKIRLLGCISVLTFSSCCQRFSSKKKNWQYCSRKKERGFPTYSELIRGTSQWVTLEGFSLRLLKSEVQSFACEISPGGKLHKRSQWFLYWLSLSAYPACDCVLTVSLQRPSVLVSLLLSEPCWKRPSLRVILICTLETSCCHVTYLLSLCAYMFCVCVPQEPLASLFFLN